MRQGTRRYILLIAAASMIGWGAACRSSTGLLGPVDETADAAQMIMDANADLKEIRKLYDANAYKREALKSAMAADDAAEVRKIADELVYLINDGAKFGKSALDKIEEARGLKINEDYADYLRLKREALTNQLNAFEEYRQAARKLRDNYNPKDKQAHAEVKADFERRSEEFQKQMEKAREYSIQANELAKEVSRRPQ
ncbi:MAG: hypothetical protein IPM25_09500 [Chloracidobacterium sp.]|nr:hypothetical protein [Chloracidobacterium sp.]